MAIRILIPVCYYCVDESPSDERMNLTPQGTWWDWKPRHLRARLSIEPLTDACFKNVESEL